MKKKIMQNIIGECKKCKDLMWILFYLMCLISYLILQVWMSVLFCFTLFLNLYLKMFVVIINLMFYSNVKTATDKIPMLLIIVILVPNIHWFSNYIISVSDWLLSYVDSIVELYSWHAAPQTWITYWNVAVIAFRTPFAQ